jgi:anti-sigma regulatory factor (Ser/Thr protein kinase)
MTHNQQRVVPVTDRSSIGEARRVALQMAELVRLESGEMGRLPLIVTELATNLLIHARGGEILLRMIPAQFGREIEVLAIDHGPGIADLGKCLADGYSTIGTRGCGLGAVRRLSSAFDIYSTCPGGTVVLARIRSLDSPSQPVPRFAVINVPAPREIECGDSWFVRLDNRRVLAAVVDGLGHGPFAAVAAAAGVGALEASSFESPARHLEAAHLAMRSTRGAAMGIAGADLESHKLHYAGIGNVSSVLIDPGGSSRSLVSRNGIVGAEGMKVQQFDYPWSDGDLLVMHSDGIDTHWRIIDYPGLIRADAAIIAAMLFRDHRRERDDATVLVARLSPH